MKKTDSEPPARRRSTYVKARKPQGRNESPPRGEARSTKPITNDAAKDGGFVNVREHIPALDGLELDELRKELAELKAKDIQPQLDELRKELAELRQPRRRRFRFFK